MNTKNNKNNPATRTLNIYELLFIPLPKNVKQLLYTVVLDGGIEKKKKK